MELAHNSSTADSAVLGTEHWLENLAFCQNIGVRCLSLINIQKNLL